MPRRDEFRTWGRRWQHRRWLVVAAATRGGVPAAVIADALDMSKSRVKAIIRAVGLGKWPSPDGRAPAAARPSARPPGCGERPGPREN